jgi:hypothetical protein
MTARGDEAVVSATLNNSRDRSAIDPKIETNVPSEIRRSDDNETGTWLSRSVGNGDCREEDENKKKSADVAG